MVVRGINEPIYAKSFEQSLFHTKHHKEAAIEVSSETTAAHVHATLESVAGGKTSRVE